VNTTHVEHDALAALRAELTMAAGRRLRRRRARRRAVVIVAVIGLLVAATAATAALISSGTGVPAVDKLLQVERRPGVRSASEPLKVPDGDHRTNLVAYLSRSDSVCVVTADFVRKGVRGGFGGCPPLADVERAARRRGGMWFGSAIGADRRVNHFLVDGRASAVRPLGRGDWRVLMTPPWTPRARQSRPLRLVTVIDERDLDVGNDGVQVGEIPDSAYVQPTLRLTYPGGTTRVLRVRGAQAK
jgi:hypothetical protein